jgi:hypothetical protein
MAVPAAGDQLVAFSAPERPFHRLSSPSDKLSTAYRVAAVGRLTNVDDLVPALPGTPEEPASTLPPVASGQAIEVVADHLAGELAEPQLHREYRLRPELRNLPADAVA